MRIGKLRSSSFISTVYGAATISTGAIANLVGTHYTVDTEGAAASDDLDTITYATAVQDRQLLLLRAANSSRTVRLTTAGNISLIAPITLNGNFAVLLVYNSDISKWFVQGRHGYQGAQGAQGAQGHQGVQGAQGHQGTVGAQGHQGVQGHQGQPGFQGHQGVPAVARVYTFTSGELSAGVYTLNHGYVRQYFAVEVFDNNGILIMPDDVTCNLGGTISIDVGSYSVSGTWTVRIV